MKNTMNKINGYEVMAFIGIVMVLAINHIVHREYYIGLAHGAGIFMFFYGLFANIVVNMRNNKKEASEE
ncbi:hypothetical protein SAMN02910298_01174 [Pseudobutyrivibrio sp. YE44]|uniref:hypothetical protein n=1 Tax=Pseudobutyrivibrio sp. YE44 TaxID=1520802 RepID=UPI000889E8B9|nr:hypothetical protein [Pseudobutyrivibrio sp. YE44]SDB23780.1 hypothetical protein SAMN02910298_01174 [Pseudobutyrivibrio sp. YE44]